MRVIQKPLITEKFTRTSEVLNQFGFIVDRKATKGQIKTEVEKLYGVKVVSVNTMNYEGKNKTRHTKRNIMKGRLKHFKKAVVTVKEGETIDFYSNI